jgi:hypothetical protein
MCGAAIGARNSYAEAFDIAPIDWHRFSALASHHRVEALAAKGLAEMGHAAPQNVHAQLTARAAEIAAANLRLISESGRLSDAFAEAGIAMIFVKGATLAKLAYDDIALKSAIDLDILVDPQDLADAARVLRTCGYRLETPKSTERLFDWHRLRKESLWVHGSSRMIVDLHTRLADSSALIPNIWTPESTRDVEVIRGLSLTTLREDALAAYLAVHGATSAWFRLKWLVDFAAIVQREHKGRGSDLRRAMIGLGAQNAGDQALHLADSMFGVLESEPATRAAVGVRWSVRAASAVAEGYLRGLAEPTARVGGTFGIHACSLLILRRPSDRLGQLVAKVRMLLSRAR